MGNKSRHNSYIMRVQTLLIRRIVQRILRWQKCKYLFSMTTFEFSLSFSGAQAFLLRLNTQNNNNEITDIP